MCASRMDSVEENVKVTKNNRLLNYILTLPKTKLWSKNISAYTPYTKVELQNESLEYKSVDTYFQLTSRMYSARKIERIENPYILGEYLLKKENMMYSNLPVQERKLFHGTSSMKLNNICKNNFNWRLKGSARGHKFGQGVSFSPDAYYASHYTSTNTMILANVLVGSATLGNSMTTVPPSGYDTTTNSKRSVIVKYEDDDFYPAYIIHYEYAGYV